MIDWDVKSLFSRNEVSAPSWTIAVNKVSNVKSPILRMAKLCPVVYFATRDSQSEILTMHFDIHTKCGGGGGGGGGIQKDHLMR